MGALVRMDHEGEGPLSFVSDVVRNRSHPADLDLQARWFLLRSKCRALALSVTGERLDPGLVDRGVRSAGPTPERWAERRSMIVDQEPRADE